MSSGISVRSSKDICTSYTQLSVLTKENPVIITVDGKEDTVLLSHEDFRNQLQYISELEATLDMYAHLSQSVDDIKHGRLQPADSAFTDVLGNLEQLRI